MAYFELFGSIYIVKIFCWVLIFISEFSLLNGDVLFRMPKRRRNEDPDPVISTFDFTVYPDDNKMLFAEEELKGLLSTFEAWREDCTRMRIAKEVCPNTKRDHLQCKLTWRVGKRWAAMRKIMGHVHFEESASKCFSYCAKLGDTVLINHDGRRQGQRSDLQACIDKAAAGASQRELFSDFGPTMVRYHAGIGRAQKALKELENLASFTAADYPNWPLIKDWSKTIVVMGPSGVGKTEWALCHFKNPLLVSEIDQLLDYDPVEHDGIIFDDLDLEKLSRNEQIAFVDQTMPRAIRCRYRSPVIPRHTKKIFTCNSMPVDNEDPAVARRIRLYLVSDRGQEMAIGK